MPHSGEGGWAPRPEEAERRGQDDVPDRVHHREDDHRGRGVRQDVPEHDPEPAVAERARGQHVLLLLGDHRLGAHDPGVADPAGDPDRDEHVEDARPQHRDDRDDQDQEREREEQVHDPHQQTVDPAAQVAGHQADNGAGDQRDAGRAERDGQVDPAAVQDPGEDVAAELVGAEQVPGGERRGERVQHVEGGRRPGYQQRRSQDRRDRDGEHDQAGDQHQAAAAGAAAAPGSALGRPQQELCGMRCPRLCLAHAATLALIRRSPVRPAGQARTG